MRWLCLVALLGCSSAHEPSCARDADCAAGAACRAGVCLRFNLEAGTPRDPADAAVTPGD